MEGNVEFKYSKNNGSTWSSAITLKANSLQVYPRRVPLKDASYEQMVYDEIQNAAISRIMVQVELDIAQFDPTDTPTTANALFVQANDVRCAPLIRMRLASDCNGYSYFTGTSASEANPLTVDDAPDPVFEDQNRSKLRNIQFTLMMCKSRSLP